MFYGMLTYGDHDKNKKLLLRVFRLHHSWLSPGLGRWRLEGLSLKRKLRAA